jgi:PAS domain S-box-containing protein
MSDVFRAVADFTYDWESWFSPKGKLLWVNPAVSRVTGYSAEECMTLRGFPLPLVHPGDLARIKEVLLGARNGTSGNDVELRILHKDRSTRWVAMSWQPMGAEGFRTSIRQVDERKRAEEELREAMRIAEEADRAKSEFLAIMSHEIRSPMHAIAGHAQLLEQTALGPDQLSHVEVIRRENAALLRIVDDVLDFSALQQRTLTIRDEAFDYRALIEDIVAASDVRAGDVDLEASVDPRVHARVKGDPDRVRQILRNLVDNALKFTRRGSVRIEVTMEGAAILTSVTDTGIGIREKDVGRVFEMFHQVDGSLARRQGGSGLGLAICKRLCERMGGTIGLETKYGRGSRFWFRLPLPRATSATSRDARDEQGARSEGAVPLPRELASRVPLDVLVVDDIAVAREVAVSLLGALGYAADSAPSGRAALAKAKKKNYDLVLLDMHMPRLDGTATAHALRGLSPETYIMALTANVFIESAPGVFDKVLTKPLQLATLAAAIESMAVDDVVLEDLSGRCDRDGRPLVAVAVEGVASQAATLLRSIERSRSTARLAEHAHALKGILLVVGARSAARRAQRVVDLARNRDSAAFTAAGHLRTAVSNALSVVRKRTHLG